MHGELASAGEKAVRKVSLPVRTVQGDWSEHTAATVHTDHEWRARLASRILAIDALAIATAVTVTHVYVLGLDPDQDLDVEAGAWSPPGMSYVAFGCLLVVSWVVMLGLNGSRRWRVLGEGPDEYKLVLQGSVLMVCLVGLVSYLLKVNVGRGYLVVLLPMGAFGLLGARWTARRWLHHERRSGHMVSRVLVVGHDLESTFLLDHVHRRPEAGLEVAAVVADLVDLDHVVRQAAELRVGAVVVCQSIAVLPQDLNALRWRLEEVGTDLIIAPSFSGIAGERVHARPIDGVPLVYVEGAHYSGGMRVAKAVVDPVLALAAIVVLMPVMLVVGLLVWLGDRGPVFYRQVRIGREGQTFRIWKFRSMRKDADLELMARLRSAGTADTPLFKLTDDDRITPLGHYLRKWSLDELPQFFNVLVGQMSLVGPRPQRPEEVALYRGYEHRRLLSKPGITGLWQVSGRSDLTWTEALELDLYYVENWSLSMDVLLLLKTVGAVARSRGAH